MGDKWNDLFYYDEESPSGIRRKVPVVGHQNNVLRSIGSVVGSVSKSSSHTGYWQTKVDYTYYAVHRIIYEMFNGKLPENMDVDHIDGNSLNNRLSNLRAVPRAVNSRNANKSRNNKTGITGVQFSEKKTVIKGKEYTNPAYIATWIDLSGKSRVKTFAVKKYGDEEAFRLAWEYREKMIAELNAQGAGYTDDHGKREAHD